jgi:hypothetical protein
VWTPPNPDGSWPNDHTLYAAVSGGGKSQALLQNPKIPKKGARVILWDHAPDHPGDHFRTKKGFLLAVRRGIERNLKTGAGFRVAFSGPRTVENYEWWCEVVWRSLDGRYRTYALAEELSAVSVSTAKATPMAAVLLNEMRKYGGVFHGTTQRPQEIPKTYFEQCENKYVGQQKTLKQLKRMAEEIGVTVEQLKALEKLQFFQDDGSAKAPELITLGFKKPTGIRWAD